MGDREVDSSQLPYWRRPLPRWWPLVPLAMPTIWSLKDLLLVLAIPVALTRLWSSAVRTLRHPTALVAGGGSATVWWRRSVAPWIWLPALIAATVGCLYWCLQIVENLPGVGPG